MKFKKKAWVKFLKWSKWLGVAALVGAVSLGYSWRSYTTSQNKGQEVEIAQVAPEGATAWEEHTVTFNQVGKVWIYYWKLQYPNINARSKIRIWVEDHLDEAQTEWLTGTSTIKETKYSVNIDDELRYVIWNHPDGLDAGQPVGWKIPVDNKCGTGTVKTDISFMINEAKEGGQKVQQKRCWEALETWFKPTKPNPVDYRDFFLIFAVKPTGSPSPSPSSLPGEKVKIRVLKFNDKDGDGNQDTGEGSTNKVWKFRVTVEGVTTPVELTTATVSGLTRWIEVTKGRDVTVKEATKSGWLVSGGLVQIAQNISADKEFKFGNKQTGVSPSPSPSLTPSPSINPNKTNFRIKKFNDKNASKTQDEGELGLKWRFKYRTKASATAEWPVEWKTDYYTATTSAGLGPKITVNKGSLVQVIEYPKTGWKATMGVKKTTVALTDPAKVYIIGFGNKLTGASPSPSVSPDKASFRIKKFNDKNKNGKLDSGETSTGKAWVFKYKIGGGEWVTGYKTNVSTGVGKIIKVAKGKKVTVEEIEQSGWKATTDKTQEKTLSQAKQYIFAFGNKREGGGGGQSPKPSSFPAKQPDTGSPTWLTVGAAGLGLILFTAKLLFKY